MHIYFSDLSYQDQFLIWSYPEGTQSAHCTYKLTGEKKTLDRDLINRFLASIPGVEIVDDQATIPNVSDFCHGHPYKVIISPDDSKILQLRANGKATFFKGGPEQNPVSSSSSQSTLLNASEATPPTSPRVKESIPLTFNSLLSDCSGETLVYDSDRPENLQSNNLHNLKTLSGLNVHSTRSINLTIQVIKNVDYYLLRSHQIKILKKIFEEELIPQINDFQKGEAPPKFVLLYLQNAVRAIMGNGRYNSKDTAFESNFYQENEPIPIIPNYHIRSIYAKTMLEALAYFIKDLPVPENNSPHLTEWLIRFKEHFQLHLDTEKLNAMIHDLEQLIICTGLMDHDYKQLQLDSLLQNGHIDFSLLQTKIKSIQVGDTTLRYALGHLNNEHHITASFDHVPPPRLYSLRLIISNWYQAGLSDKSKNKLKEQGTNELIKETLESALAIFLACTNNGDKTTKAAELISHTIKTHDSDIYINQIWKVALETQLISATRILSGSKKNNSNHEKLKAEIINTITCVVDNQLMFLKEAEDPLLSQPSSSY